MGAKLINFFRYRPWGEAQQNSIWNRNPKIIEGGEIFPPLQLSTYDCYVRRSKLKTYSIAGKPLIGHACTFEFDAILC